MEEEQQVTDATQAEEDSPEHPDVPAAREQRIADYLTQSLEVGDPFEANVGMVNADLMFLVHRYQQALGGALEEPPEDLAELAEITPSVDSYLRLVKQMDRISQLAMKLKAANGAP